MPRSMIAVALVAFLAGTGAFWAAAEYGRERARAVPAALSSGPQTPEAAADDAGPLVGSLLERVYAGFALSDEGEIYDTLADAAHGEALEALYLARAGALASAGLTEADQTVHEIRVIRARPRTVGETVMIDAAWQVVGTVGHGEHVHVRGNTYRAELAIAMVDEAWKMTGFRLVDVDRTGAGELFEAH